VRRKRALSGGASASARRKREGPGCQREERGGDGAHAVACSIGWAERGEMGRSRGPGPRSWAGAAQRSWPRPVLRGGDRKQAFGPVQGRISFFL